MEARYGLCDARTKVAWKCVSALIQADVLPALAASWRRAASPASTSAGVPCLMACVMPSLSSHSRRSLRCATDSLLRLSIRLTVAARLVSGLRRT